MSHTKDKWLSPTAVAEALDLPRATLNTQIARGMYGELEREPARRGGPRKFYYADILLSRLGQVLLAFYNDIAYVGKLLNKIVRHKIANHAIKPENACLLVRYRGRVPAGETVRFENGKVAESSRHESYDQFVLEWIDKDNVKLCGVETDTLVIRVFAHAAWAQELIASEGQE